MRNAHLTICSLFIFLTFGCGSKTQEHQSAKVKFALAKIKQAENAVGSATRFEYAFIIDDSLSEQSYEIKINNNEIEVKGGDSLGLMYGGLQVAEDILNNKQPREDKGAPYLKKRGIKFNIPLDARTPSYDDSGDAAQLNIGTMWEWDFWENYLDKMAIYRYNTLSLWNPHPFPSMIKQGKYPEVALNDVMKTTLIPVGKENEWGDPQLVTSNVMDNLTAVKTLTIEEKIAFWKKVFQHAKNRGIDVYFITWNICPNSVAKPVEPFYKTFGMNMTNEQPGKYGISHDFHNEKTVAYYRDAVKTFLLTYPDVKGIGVTAGEHMPKTFEKSNKEEWLWNTYGLGILDAKKEQPDRKVDFIHRVWFSDMDQIMNYWKDYPDDFSTSFKYAKARLYSDPKPPFALKHNETMRKYKLHSWWNLRNDDIFVYRWGDPEYVRQFLQNFPNDITEGYYWGADGYIWGKDFMSKKDGLKEQYEIDKQWYQFMLWGRLGYDNELSISEIQQMIAIQYPNVDSKKLFDVWSKASKIVPLVNKFHWRDWDHHWSVEGCIARPALGGFREVTDFMNNRTMQGSKILNPKEFVSKTLAGENIEKETPVSVIETLKNYNSEVLQQVKELRALKDGSLGYNALLDDLEAMAHLGGYYAEKIGGALNLCYFEADKTGGKVSEYKSEAIKHMENAKVHWDLYTTVSTKNYKPQMLARTHMLDWEALAENVKEDIIITKNYK